MYETNEAEVLSVINSLKNKKSVGDDGISNYLVKLVKNAIACPLAHIINLSMSTGIFPRAMKKTIIKALFKKGVKTLLSNYRPIALITPFSKIFEKIFLKRILSFLDKNNVISDKQFGYKKGTSCVDAVVKLNDLVLNCKKEGIKVLAIFLDLSKAFDCVSHDTLLSILNKYGIRGVAHDLLESYLLNREQAVEISSNQKSTSKSEFKPVRKGVPQGSVKGPHLFLIYVNCIEKIIKNFDCDCILYVDDTTIIVKGKSLSEIKEKPTLVIKAIYNLFASLNLALNLEKTTYMLFNNDYVDLNLEVNSVKISPAVSTKFLGLCISSNLSWKPQIQSITKCLNKGIFVLKQTGKSINRNHNQLVFNAFIQSYLSFGILLWGGLSGNLTQLEALFKKQKRALRLLLGISDQRTSCRGLFKKCNSMTLFGMYLYFAALYAKKHLANHSYASVHQHNTRNKNNIFQNHCLEGEVRGNCIKIFNKLPLCIKSIDDYLVFKRKLKRYVIERECYSYKEFIE